MPKTMPSAMHLSSKQIDEILKIKTMIITKVGIYTHEVDENITKPWNTTQEASKNVVISNHLSLDLLLKQNAIRKLVQQILKNLAKSPVDPKTLEICVPIQTKCTVDNVTFDHSVLFYFKPTKNFNKERGTGYKLILVNPAISEKSPYKDKFEQFFAADGFVEEFEDLSSDQLLNNPRSDEYKLEPLLKNGTFWASGHIFIDNALRMIRDNPIVPTKFHTFLYKVDLLRENSTLISFGQTKTGAGTLTDTEVSNTNADLVQSTLQNFLEFVIEGQVTLSSQYIRYLLNNRQAWMMPSTNETVSYIFQLLYTTILSLESRCVISSNNFNDKIYPVIFSNVKSILKLKDNIETLLIISLLFEIHKIYNMRTQDKNGILYLFFTTVPHKTHELQNQKLDSLKNLTINMKKYSDIEQKVLTTSLVMLAKQPQLFLDYIEATQKLFPAMPAYFSRIMKKFPANIISQCERGADNITTTFKDFKTKFQKIQESFGFLSTLPNHGVQQELLRDSEDAHKRFALLKNTDKTFTNKKFRKAFEIKSKAAPQKPVANQSVDEATEDTIQKLIESLKKVAITNTEGMFKILEKINNILAIAHNKKLPLQLKHKLQLASCLIVPFACLQHKLSDFNELDPIILKVKELCSYSPEDAIELQLNANVLTADLYCILGGIYDAICNQRRYRLLGDTFDRFGLLKMICRPENIGVRFHLMQEYALVIAEMNHHMALINEFMKKLPFPTNPQGLYWSIGEYSKREKQYLQTLEWYERQNDQYLQRNHEFAKILMSPEKKAQFFPASYLKRKHDTPSIAAQANREFANKLVDYSNSQMRSEHTNCVSIIESLTHALQSKSDSERSPGSDVLHAKQDTMHEQHSEIDSLAYIDELPLFELRSKRRASMCELYSIYGVNELSEVKLRRTESTPNLKLRYLKLSTT